MNGDGVINVQDLVPVSTASNANKAAISGLRSVVGILSTPAFINVNSTLENIYDEGSTSKTETLGHSTGGRFGRITWRELVP